MVRAALMASKEAARISLKSVPTDEGDVKEHDRKSEELTSLKDRFPADGRALEFLLSANVRREKTSPWRRGQTEACEIFNTRRWTRSHR